MCEGGPSAVMRVRDEPKVAALPSSPTAVHPLPRGVQGDYVILAAEPSAVCGCDVAAPQEARRGRQQPLEQFFSSFTTQFTAVEWASIRAAGADDMSKEAQFRCAGGGDTGRLG